MPWLAIEKGQFGWSKSNLHILVLRDGDAPVSTGIFAYSVARPQEITPMSFFHTVSSPVLHPLYRIKQRTPLILLQTLRELLVRTAASV